MNFKLDQKLKPKGDQPEAIRKLVAGLRQHFRYQTLLGVTGSGKTFTMANVIAKINKPTLVIAHNKTLAAQLCNEFREFFPHHAVDYFVSYYDYYQPEAYIPSSDTYIEKEAQINQEIDRLRHEATQALLTRRDVIIVASVSCIYGLGAPVAYEQMHLKIKVGDSFERGALLRKLIEIQFERTTLDLKRGTFRARGNVIELMPISQEIIYRIQIGADRIETIVAIDPVSRRVLEKLKNIWIFPAKHFITPPGERVRAMAEIKQELKARLLELNQQGKLLEAERLERRTNYDMSMLREVGYCHGIENYSRALSGRQAGSPPDTLLSYFPKDFLTFIDESHVTVPQLQGMYHGDAARKRNLIDFGFRLPSAADNRPLQFDEFLERNPQTIFVSATPSVYEQSISAQIVEQVIRPTGLVDPQILIRPVTPSASEPGQIDDLMARVVERSAKAERSLVTTLTKKMAEDLTEFLKDRKLKVAYLHSDVATIDRVKILTDLRRGTYDVLVGVNLLREGLDLPEVSLVAILDADKEGFLRSATSLVQTIGRSSRHVNGLVIMYADVITEAMAQAIRETDRRRQLQLRYNQEHQITPTSIKKAIKDIMEGITRRDAKKIKTVLAIESKGETRPLVEVIEIKEREMRAAAKNLEFELAALLRDEIRELKNDSRF